MGDPDWFIVINPASGGGRATRAWPQLRRALDRAGLAYRSGITSAPGDAQAMVRAAIASGHRRLLALGGDGALHELVNGLLGQDRVPAAELLACVAPLGTGNDWATHLGVPQDPDRLAACLRRGRRRSVDVGMLECRDLQGERTVKVWFHNVCGAGFDAHVLAHTPRHGPRKLAYLAGIARGLGSFRPPVLSVRADGQQRSARGFLVVAAIGPLCGGGMQLAPEAVIDDGWMDLTMIDAMPAWKVPTKLPKVFNGRLLSDPAAWGKRCRSAEVSSDPPSRIEADGQLVGTTPMALRILPGALSVLDCRDGGDGADGTQAR